MNESNSKHNVLKFEHAGYDLYIRDVWWMRIYIIEMCCGKEFTKQIVKKENFKFTTPGDRWKILV